MTLEVTDDTIGIWFATFHGRDLMVNLSHQPDGAILLVYRFRHYAEPDSGDPFDDRDRKSWYRNKLRLTRDEAIEKVRSWLVVSAASLGGDHIFELIKEPDQSPEDFSELLLSMPWAHSKQVTREEYERDYGKGAG